MEIINFEKEKQKRQSKAKRQSEEKVTKHLPVTDIGVLELQKQYKEIVQFYEQWYDKHVIGQNKDGSWIYKN